MKITVLLIFFISNCLAAASGVTLPSLSMPGIMMVMADHLVISDTKTSTIHVFNLAGKELAVFGKQGQGPGEYTGLESLQLRPSGIVVSSGEKVLIFNYEGQLLEERRLPATVYDLLQSNRGWFGSEIMQNGNDLLASTFFYKADFSDKKALGQRILPSPFGAKIEMVEHCIRIESGADKVFTVDTDGGLVFTLYSETGEIIAKFNKPDYRKIAISQEWKNQKIAELKASPQIAANWNLIQNKLHFPQYYPAIHDYSVSENGTILARTYQIQNGKNLYYLLDSGKSSWREIELTDKIALSRGSSSRHFCNNNSSTFFLIENEEGYFELFSQTL